MPARLTAALLTSVLLFLTTAGAAAAEEPLRSLGGDSPLCEQAAIGARARASCRSTGAIDRPYPLSRYRFDWHIDTGLTRNPENNLLAAFQWLLSMAWLALLYVLSGVLLAFQWAFSLDLLQAAMTPVRRTLTELHDQTLGQPWMLAAITLLGLWGIWRGLIQRRGTQTAAGLAAAIAMMAGALFVIARPAETLGALSRGANDVSLGFLAGAGDGTLRTPARSIADSSQRVFDTVVLRPWCAMDFTDVAWCLGKAPGDRMTRAERWLRYEPDTRARDAEFEILDNPAGRPWKNRASILGVSLPGGDLLQRDDPAIRRQLNGYQVSASDKDRVAIQTKDATAVRVGLFCLIAAGMLGAILLLGWLVVRVLLQGLLTLVLLLAAPVLLLAPAFGEAGRNLFATWAKRLFAATVAKAIYALLLAIVLAVNTALASMDTTLPWLATWLVAAVFWWGVLLKRNELLGWLSLGTQPRHDATLTRAYYATRIARPATAALTTGATATALSLPRAAVATAQAGHTRQRAHHDRQRDAVSSLAREELHARARERLEHRYQQLHTRLERHDDAREKHTALTRRIGVLDRHIDQRTQQRDRAHDPADRNTHQDKLTELQATRGRLIAQRKALETRLMPRSEEGVARRFIEAADRSRAETGQRFTERQLDLQLAELRGDLDRPADDPVHQWRQQPWRPGLPDTTLATLNDEERRDLHGDLDTRLERDRALLRALPANPEALPTRRDIAAARRHLPGADIRRQRRALHRRSDSRRTR